MGVKQSLCPSQAFGRCLDPVDLSGYILTSFVANYFYTSYVIWMKPDKYNLLSVDVTSAADYFPSLYVIKMKIDICDQHETMMCKNHFLSRTIQ